MGDEHVVFLERPLVEQHLQPLARRQLALGVLRIDPRLPATETGFIAGNANAANRSPAPDQSARERHRSLAATRPMARCPMC
jgi:hypothetical protein